MKIHKCTQITFEAFGMEHIVFTDILDFECFETEVGKICPTAHITNVCTTVTDLQTFHLNNLENLIKWNESIFQRLNETEDEAN